MQNFPDVELSQALVCLVPEDELSASNHKAIQNLLRSAFPQYENIFSHSSYWGARPSYRLWMEVPSGEIIAHLDFELRFIKVGKSELLIAGIGEVATHPRFHKSGLGRSLMEQLQNILQTSMPVQFGYLQCRRSSNRFLYSCWLVFSAQYSSVYGS